MKLPADQREQLVDELKATPHSGFASEKVEQAWATEIRAAGGGNRLGQRLCSATGTKSGTRILAELRGGT